MPGVSLPGSKSPEGEGGVGVFSLIATPAGRGAAPAPPLPTFLFAEDLSGLILAARNDEGWGMGPPCAAGVDGHSSCVTAVAAAAAGADGASDPSKFLGLTGDEPPEEEETETTVAATGCSSCSFFTAEADA